LLTAVIRRYFRYAKSRADRCTAGLSAKKPKQNQRLRFFSALRSPKSSCEKCGGEQKRNSSQINALDRTVLNGQSRELWREPAREREFRPSVGAAECGGLGVTPAITGPFCALASRRECWLCRGWRREKNWDPTFSEFVAPNLPEGEELYSNCPPEITKRILQFAGSGSLNEFPTSDLVPKLSNCSSRCRQCGLMRKLLAKSCVSDANPSVDKRPGSQSHFRACLAEGGMVHSLRRNADS
jgi:hypothetical protein